MDADDSLNLTNLHRETELAHPLFLDGHYPDAVRKAAERWLNRVAEIADHPDRPEIQQRFGSDLVNWVLSPKRPLISFPMDSPRAERTFFSGYHSLGLGLTLAVRNVMTHADHYPLAQAEAYEWLGFISAMHRHLDRAYQIAPSEVASSEDNADSDKGGQGEDA